MVKIRSKTPLTCPYVGVEKMSSGSRKLREEKRGIIVILIIKDGLFGICSLFCGFKTAVVAAGMAWMNFFL